MIRSTKSHTTRSILCASSQRRLIPVTVSQKIPCQQKYDPAASFAETAGFSKTTQKWGILPFWAVFVIPLRKRPCGFGQRGSGRNSRRRTFCPGCRCTHRSAPVPHPSAGCSSSRRFWGCPAGRRTGPPSG